MITHLRRCRDDEGRIALFVVIMAFVVLVVIGLAVDGGGKVRALQRADNIAAEAARAAAQAIDLDQAATGGRKEVDPDRAVAAARQYLAAAGVSGTVTLSGDRQHVTVTVTAQYDPVILDLIGYGQLTVTGHGSAQLLTG